MSFSSWIPMQRRMKSQKRKNDHMILDRKRICTIKICACKFAYFNNMWGYLLILIGVLLLIGLLWVMQPYKNWKKNFDARQYEPVTITDRKKVVKNITDYKNSSK